MAQYAAQSPVYFKSSADYLQYLIHCKCYVNRQIQGLLFGTFWKPPPSNIFDSQLLESADTESLEVKD